MWLDRRLEQGTNNLGLKTDGVRNNTVRVWQAAELIYKKSPLALLLGPAALQAVRELVI